jgi:hypothetical protein
MCRVGKITCDCNGLELASDAAHDFIPSLVTVARSEGLLLRNECPGSFIHSQQLPADRLMADASASDLPDTHDRVVLFGDANGVDLNVPREAIVSELKDVP